MTRTESQQPLRCSRCGRVSADDDNFCAECGMFLRDAFLDHRFLLAMAHESEGKSREARRGLERLVASDPDNALANHCLGVLYFHQGTLDLAIACYRHALKHAPRFVLCWYDLGVASYHRGNMPEAVRAFRRCLELDPHYNAAHYRLGLSLFHAGKLHDAIEQFEEAAALTPEYLMANYHLGVIHERLDNAEEAARAFRRGSDESIGEVSSRYHLAMIRKQQGDSEAARELLEGTNEFARALETQPQTSEEPVGG